MNVPRPTTLARLASAWPLAIASAALACAARPATTATATAPAAASPAGPDATGAQPAPESAEPRPGTGTAVIETTEGPITMTFYPDVAPRTVAHITALMAAGCYQGVDFFRLEPGFVIQVEPVSDEACHPDALATVPAEFSRKAPHERLALSMARFEDPDSGTSSWSIMLGAAPSMDGQYTVFGRVVAGEDTIRKIEAIGSTKADDGMRRLDRKVTIQRVELTYPDSE